MFPFVYKRKIKKRISLIFFMLGPCEESIKYCVKGKAVFDNM